MATIVPEPPDDSPALVLRRAAETLNARSTTGTYGDPCGECGLTGSEDDALADALDDMASRIERLSAAGLKFTSTRLAGQEPLLAVARAVLGDDA